MDAESVGSDALVEQVSPTGHARQADKAPGQVGQYGGVRDEGREEVNEENPGEDEILSVDKVGAAVTVFEGVRESVRPGGPYFLPGVITDLPVDDEGATRKRGERHAQGNEIVGCQAVLGLVG